MARLLILVIPFTCLFFSAVLLQCSFNIRSCYRLLFYVHMSKHLHSSVMDTQVDKDLITRYVNAKRPPKETQNNKNNKN